MKQYDFRKQVADQKRIDEALAQSHGGATFIQGGKPSNSVREVSRPASGHPLALPFDEITPHQVNVASWNMYNTPGSLSEIPQHGTQQAPLSTESPEDD